MLSLQSEPRQYNLNLRQMQQVARVPYNVVAGDHHRKESSSAIADGNIKRELSSEGYYFFEINYYFLNIQFRSADFGKFDKYEGIFLMEDAGFVVNSCLRKFMVLNWSGIGDVLLHFFTESINFIFYFLDFMMICDRELLNN